jgi:hypothetical protein
MYCTLTSFSSSLLILKFYKAMLQPYLFTHQVKEQLFESVNFKYSFQNAREKILGTAASTPLPQKSTRK